MERLYRYLDRKYSKREQVGLAAAGVTLLLFLFFQVVISPVIHKKSRMEGEIVAQKKALMEMVALKNDFDQLKRSSELSERHFLQRDKKFTLFSFLDQLAGQSGVKENISYMKPTSSKKQETGLKKSIVEIKLNDITLNQLTSYLHGIETSKNMVFVKRLSITKKGEQDGFITVVLQAETVES
jgi:general secretion pathway protein M